MVWTFSPTFGIRTLLTLVTPVTIAVILLVVVSKRGTGVFKKQGVAWGLTVLMVFAAIGIGYAKAPINNPTPEPDYPAETIPPASMDSFVWDFADVLSSGEVQLLDQRNERLWNRYQITIGVVTTNNGGDLYDYAMDAAEEMALGGYDMIVVLDIAGDNYWLLQGNDIRRDFTDDDCSYYANEYLEYWFARGIYGEAVEQLTDALEDWYANYFD